MMIKKKTLSNKSPTMHCRALSAIRQRGAPLSVDFTLFSHLIWMHSKNSPLFSRIYCQGGARDPNSTNAMCLRPLGGGD